jgi:hypothetical protein
MDSCLDGLTDKVGSVIEAIGWPDQIVSLWTCRRTHIWTIPDTIGTAISPTENAILDAHQVMEMTKGGKQNMDAHGMSCESKSVYDYKGIKYERLADAVRCAETDAARRRPYDDNS